MAAIVKCFRNEKNLMVISQICGRRIWKPSISEFTDTGVRRRLSSSAIEPQPGQSNSQSNHSDEPWSENDYVNPKIENRNPRNLEKMSLAIMQKGFKLDSPTTKYYHKLILERGPKHTRAYVQHCSGSTVVSASTQEWAIRQHLYSGSDVCSAKNIGRIIAQRCLESGILHVHVNFTQEEQKSEAVSDFLKAVENGGLSLEEPYRIYPLRPWD